MEGDRRREKLKFPDVERARRQVADMDVFDALINNLDRTQGNFLWDKESWQLWLIDHTRALGRDRKVPSPEQIKRCSRGLMDRLERLEARSVKRALNRYLTPREVSALLARREHLLELLAERIAAQGEEAVLFDLHGPTSDETVTRLSPEASPEASPDARPRGRPESSWR